MDVTIGRIGHTLLEVKFLFHRVDPKQPKNFNMRTGKNQSLLRLSPPPLPVHIDAHALTPTLLIQVFYLPLALPPFHDCMMILLIL